MADSALFFLPDHRVFICLSCQYGVRAKNLRGHFQKIHHYSGEQLEKILQTRNASLAGEAATDERVRIPEFVTSALPHLPVFDDGLLCQVAPESCHYICRRRDEMRRHCRRVHQWTQFQRRGQPSRSTRSRQDVEGIEPWKPVHCQRIFPSQSDSQYFEVREVRGSLPVLPDTVRARVNHLHGLAQHQAYDRITADLISQTSPWLLRTGWARYLVGLDRPTLMQLAAPPEPSDADDLQAIWDAAGEMIVSCEYTAIVRAGIFVRMEIVQNDSKIRRHQPLQPYLRQEDRARYSRPWQQVLMFFLRVEDHPEPASVPSFQFNPRQRTKFTAMLTLARAAHDDDDDRDVVSQDSHDLPHPLQPLHLACLEFCISLLDHPSAVSEYECPLICALAVLGIKDNGWKGHDEYPSLLSAMMKTSRYMVIQFAVEQGRDQRTYVNSPGFQLVQDMVRRFMSRGTATPFEWMLDLRSYGIKIAMNTFQEGHVSWIGEQILYKDIQFTMNEFRGFIHGLVYTASRILEEDLLLAPQISDMTPTVAPRDLRDFPGEKRAGWSFLDDPRSTWPVKGDEWLLNQVLARPALTKAFYPRLDHQGAPPRAVQKYIESITAFRMKLVLLIHLTSGQPARMSELLTVRHRNQTEDEHRNVFIEDGLVCLITRYHKGYTISGEYKVIPRYVPDVVGLMIIQYLWLVLPFHERLLTFYFKSTTLSSLLWPEENDQGSWDTIRVRKALQEESQIGLGLSLNIQSYRHVAIAMGRRFLSSEHQIAENDDDNDADDADDTEDNIFDLQAAHSSRTAGMVYARTVHELPGEVASYRRQYREASLAWHRLLRFHLAIGPEAPERGHKRHLSTQDDSQEIRQKRWRNLRRYDLVAQLRQLLGPLATFRPLQQEAIQAILDDHSPVLTVMPTGAGKSLIYLLPASYPGSGCTIVVVPLVALRDDLVRRCQQLSIFCQAWSPRQPPDAASIVLVTPESAMTAAFSSFINRLRTTGRLDRIVIDECHLILDPNKTFRQAIHRLGELVRAETPLLFLTATLPPNREALFWKNLGLSSQPAYCFRGPTTRVNIRYRVHCCPRSIMLAYLRTQIQAISHGRIIIYCQTVDEVQQLRSALQCAAYHSQYPHKDRDLDEFIQSRQRTIVATSALGLGIDLPDVRLVIHMNQPRNLLEYAQESGRAGRDGQPAESLILRSGEPAQLVPPQDLKLRQLVQPCRRDGRCRRILLDEYLDGRHGRVTCVDPETICDICQARISVSPRILPVISAVSRVKRDPPPTRAADTAAAPLILDTDPPTVRPAHAEADSLATITYLRNQKQRRVARLQQQQSLKQDSLSFADQVATLSSLYDCCLPCLGQTLPSHPLTSCTSPERDLHFDTMTQLSTQIKYAKYSCCWKCGIPQSLCASWTASANGYRRSGRACQFPRLMMAGAAWFLPSTAVGPFQPLSLYQRVLERSIPIGTIISPADRHKILQFLGQKRTWGPVECTELFFEFLRFFSPLLSPTTRTDE